MHVTDHQLEGARKEMEASLLARDLSKHFSEEEISLIVDAIRVFHDAKAAEYKQRNQVAFPKDQSDKITGLFRRFDSASSAYHKEGLDVKQKEA